MSKKVVIYTDGACSGNPGPGGWACIIRHEETEKEICGHETHTTNNRMELMAAINSLKALKEPCHVALYSDSVYVKDGITKWIHGWKKNGWRSSTKQPVKNIDLWMELESAAEQHEVSWHWVKGHAGDPMNVRVDKLAVEAIKHAKS